MPTPAAASAADAFVVSCSSARSGGAVAAAISGVSAVARVEVVASAGPCVDAVNSRAGSSSPAAVVAVAGASAAAYSFAAPAFLPLLQMRRRQTTKRKHKEQQAEGLNKVSRTTSYQASFKGP